MKIYNTSKGILVQSDNSFYLVNENWDDFFNNDNLYSKLEGIVKESSAIDNAEDIVANHLLVPMNGQELWASGVTYYNSKLGRQEESKDAGGGDYYERVYNADRPEIFFKATNNRVVPAGGKVNIRKDSTWDVPEPELTLAITSSGKIIGYTIGNDMSSRSIEGENPLYLPQAKTYDACAALGPCIYVTDKPLSTDTKIAMNIKRNGQVVFEGATQVNEIKRKFDDLVKYLYKECSFVNGSFLMTGTGIVPTTAFTLQSGDEINITIDSIGTLTNYVR
ncbi:fumarylacetoacetate hydrolase family protein [Flavobacteriaceae bacterium XHP0103]|uniref:fumarylacetoacetate hydrolase family protein n=1 Tax=Marixanthotalea marina TaxID=2844359 RepID=UPI002989B31A|nr:fumarylacetoacetate hydrolase family protein [Marixanthotalea marina]MBU3821005.1 fumarylacetoacetate hydrolase family protein [Marixanthotalea marina]